jgi:hypothetical protein
MAIVSTFVLIFDLGIIRQTLPFRSRKKTAEAMVMAGGAVTAFVDSQMLSRASLFKTPRTN